MSNTTIPTNITLDDAVKAIVGEHYQSLKNEMCDWNNDLRVASTREVMDLDIPRETAEKVLYLVRDVYTGKTPAEALADA
jgi:hypothetical protein